MGLRETPALTPTLSRSAGEGVAGASWSPMAPSPALRESNRVKRFRFASVVDRT